MMPAYKNLIFCKEHHNWRNSPKKATFLFEKLVFCSKIRYFTPEISKITTQKVFSIRSFWAEKPILGAKFYPEG